MRRAADKTFHYKTLQSKAAAYVEASRVVSGYLAAFNNVDDVGDRLIKGCFTKSIKEHGVDSSSHCKLKLCWQHDMSRPIGSFTVLTEDDAGLYFEAQLDDIPFVNETVIPQYKSGTLNQHSIGFWYVQVEENKAETTPQGWPIYDVKEVRLLEGSVVTAGCNENTPFLGFKSLAGLNLQSELATLTKSLPYNEQMRIKQLFDALVQTHEYTRHEPLSEPVKPQQLVKKQLFKYKT